MPTNRSFKSKYLPEGVTVNLQVGNSISEILSLGHAKDESAIVQGFYRAFGIDVAEDIKAQGIEDGGKVRDVPSLQRDLQGMTMGAAGRASRGSGVSRVTAKQRDEAAALLSKNEKAMALFRGQSDAELVTLYRGGIIPPAIAQVFVAEGRDIIGMAKAQIAAEQASKPAVAKAEAATASTAAPATAAPSGAKPGRQTASKTK